MQYPGVMPGAPGQPTYANNAYAPGKAAYPQYMPAQAQPKVAQTMPLPVPAKAPAPALYQPAAQQGLASLTKPGVAVATLPPPASPKQISPAPVGAFGTSPAAQGAATRVVAGVQPVAAVRQVVTQQGAMQATASVTVREQVLERRLHELERELAQKDRTIKELQAALSKAGIKAPSSVMSVRSPGRAGNSAALRSVAGGAPIHRYQAVDQDDPADVRLEEFYNATGSAIPFQRINKGFYRFGEQICELQVINHKLMSRTEDGWNRGKFGPIEKFLMHYENIEREKGGIPLEP